MGILSSKHDVWYGRDDLDLVAVDYMVLNATKQAGSFDRFYKFSNLETIAKAENHFTQDSETAVKFMTQQEIKNFHQKYRQSVMEDVFLNNVYNITKQQVKNLPKDTFIKRDVKVEIATKSFDKLDKATQEKLYASTNKMLTYLEDSEVKAAKQANLQQKKRAHYNAQIDAWEKKKSALKKNPQTAKKKKAAAQAKKKAEDEKAKARKAKADAAAAKAAGANMKPNNWFDFDPFSDKFQDPHVKVPTQPKVPFGFDIPNLGKLPSNDSMSQYKPQSPQQQYYQQYATPQQSGRGGYSKYDQPEDAPRWEPIHEQSQYPSYQQPEEYAPSRDDYPAYPSQYEYPRQPEEVQAEQPENPDYGSQMYARPPPASPEYNEYDGAPSAEEQSAWGQTSPSYNDYYQQLQMLQEDAGYEGFYETLPNLEEDSATCEANDDFLNAIMLQN